MSRLLVVALLVVLSFGSYAGFDAGGGGGKVAIALKNRVINSDGPELDQNNNLSLGVEYFREVVTINAQKKELTILTDRIAVADTLVPQCNRAGARAADPLIDFKAMAEQGDVTILLIDFKAFKQENGKLVLKLKDDWGTSLKVYQIRQGGEVIEHDSQEAFELKGWNDVETNFSVHLFLDDQSEVVNP